MSNDNVPSGGPRQLLPTAAPSGLGAAATPPILRSAVPSDQPFAEHLYLEVMRPLLVALGHWDGPAVIRRFREGYRQEEVRIVLEGHAPIGWLQVTEQPNALMLSQIHLVPAARCRGIGTALLRELLARADHEGRSVTLWVLKNNPARSLYERLGFRLVGAEAYKLRMEWTPAGDSVSRSSPELAP